MRIFGSNQEALRAAKLVPTKGTLPLAATLNWNEGGPCDRLNTVRGSPGGDCTLAVARYSSKLLLSVEVRRSAVIMPKLPRNTHFGLKLYASPRRGCQLL